MRWLFLWALAAVQPSFHTGAREGRDEWRKLRATLDPPDADEESADHQVRLEGVAAITFTVTSEDGSRERTYRVMLGSDTLEVALEAGWNSPEWTGADGASVVEVLEAGLSDEVLAIYWWDEAAGRWLGHFPGLVDIPGLNTLTSSATAIQ